MFKQLFLLVLIMITMTSSLQGQEVSFMTYNIRLDVASDGENAWPERKDFLVDQIQFLTPSIFGIQEGLPHQTKYIKSTLVGYDFIGHGRDGGDKGEYSAIFYNTEVFTVTQENTFWLSNTPDKFSMGWDAAYPRICTYGLFTSKITGEQFWVFNTHLDHKGAEARKEGLALVRKKISELNTDGLPVVLMGDFNTEPDHEIIEGMEQLMVDSKKIAAYTFGPEATFNGFKTNEIPTARIDYIFLSKASGYKVKNYAALSSIVNLKYPSDHFPVFVSLITE